MSGKLLFQLPGFNPIEAEWQSRNGNHIAFGLEDSIKVWDRSGRISWEQRAKRPNLKWDYEGQILSIIQQKTHSR